MPIAGRSNLQCVACRVMPRTVPLGAELLVGGYDITAIRLSKQDAAGEAL